MREQHQRYGTFTPAQPIEPRHIESRSEAGRIAEDMARRMTAGQGGHAPPEAYEEIDAQIAALEAEADAVQEGRVDFERMRAISQRLRKLDDAQRVYREFDKLSDGVEQAIERRAEIVPLLARVLRIGSMLAVEMQTIDHQAGVIDRQLIELAGRFNHDCSDFRERARARREHAQAAHAAEHAAYQAALGIQPRHDLIGGLVYLANNLGEVSQSDDMENDSDE